MGLRPTEQKLSSILWQFSLEQRHDHVPVKHSFASKALFISFSKRCGDHNVAWLGNPLSNNVL